MPSDVIEHLCRFLDAKDVLNLACCSKSFRDIALTRTVWVGLLLRSFSAEELPKDLGFLYEQSAQRLRAQFRQLTLQRPAFLSDAPRTSEIMEHTGSRFSKVLHIDGRRDLNFTTVFRSVPPGQYAVLWRVMLQPGYVRGYCNFRAVFSRPASAKAASAKSKRRSCSRAAAERLGAEPQGRGGAGQQQQQSGRHRRRWRFGQAPAPEPLSEDEHRSGGESDADVVAAGGGAHAQGVLRKLRLRRGLQWLPRCVSAAAVRALDVQQPDGQPAAAGDGGHADQPAGAAAPPAPLHVPYPHQPEHPGDHQLAGHPEIEPLPPPLPALVPPPPPAAAAAAAPPPRAAAPPADIRQGALQRHLASASAKRDAAMAAGGGGGPRYVPRWLSPLWGGHACSWRQLQPAGPLGHGAWRLLHLGSLTVRRSADVHLHSVMVQLRPLNAAQQQLALPPGETRWRGALVDYVELVPMRRAGLLAGLLPGFLLPGSPVFPEMGDVVEVRGI